MSGWKKNIFEQTRAEIWFFFTQNLGCCLIGQLHVYNFIRQVWLMLQNSYCCKFSWISDTNYLNFRHLWIRHRLLFYRHYYILYRHILFILFFFGRQKRRFARMIEFFFFYDNVGFNDNYDDNFSNFDDNYDKND